MDEEVDNSPLVHSTSIFQYLSFMVLNDSELQMMESEWKNELDGILDFVDENVNITTKPVLELDGKDMSKYFLGPIIGHSLDGDSRRRMLMLKDYYSTTCMRYQIPWEG